MSASAEQFFPPRAERGVLPYVFDLPFPLALTYSRLHDELDRQKPVPAALQLRDAYECVLKFSACLAVADCLNSRPPPEIAEKLVVRLLKYGGLLVSDWHSLLVDALKPLEVLAVAGALSGSGRVLPELVDVFFDVQRSGLKANELNLEINHGRDPFVQWRNERLAHGVFQRDLAVYAGDVLRWLPALHRFYEALRPVLDTRQLVSVAPGGEELWWRGAEHRPLPAPHEHEPLGEPLPMFLAPGPGEAGERLPLSPLLSVQPCATCGQPTAFFFDKYKPTKQSPRSFCLEYFGGHLRPVPDWREVGELARQSPEKLVWKPGSYDPGEIAKAQGVVFQDFETEYLPPDYLFEDFWRVLREEQKGYIHLVGEGGTGKSYFVRGLEDEGVDRGTPVLSYYIRPGEASKPAALIVELLIQAAIDLKLRVPPGIQHNVSLLSELPDKFVEFVSELMRANGRDNFVVALDAIDELPDPEPNTPAITDFLPPAEKLPRGCFVLLTGRKRLRPKIQEDLDRRIRGKDGLYTPIHLLPNSLDNRRLVGAYVAAYFERLIQQRELTEVYRSPDYVGAVLERSRGIFLYARHLAVAMASGAFADPDALPEGNEFYPTYLDRLRGRVGERLYGTVYLPVLLLLSAAQEPVTLEQLHRWGVPPEGLRLALYDIADFMREHRGRLWHDSLSDAGENRYELAHEAFARYVREDSELSGRYRESHARIARAALDTHAGSRWTNADPMEEADLYDLRHALTHLREAEDTQAEEALLADEGYASACWSAGYLASERARYLIGVDLNDRAVRVYRNLVEVQGRRELANDLASALNNRGAALSDQGELAGAVRDYTEAIGIRRDLVEVQGRRELANDLAGALVNHALVLESTQQWPEALDCYVEAIYWREYCIRAGMLHLTSLVLQTIRYRMMTLLDLKRWEEAAADITRILDHALPFLQEDAVRDAIREGVVNERRALVDVLRRLEPPDRERVYAELDEWTEVVRGWVEGQ